tara:strand:+ start:2040 stop:4577 length:2538 start_codon:yes stop_codon:yes gene_type:complete
MAEVIEVQIIADDSQIVGALNNISEQADQLAGSMTGVSAGIGQGLDGGAIDEAAESMADLGTTTAKTTGNMRGFTRGGGRAISAMSRITGVGGRATASLASMGAMLAGTPFGAFALAAAAATAAYSLFAGNSKEKTAELVANNEKLKKSLDETTAAILENQTDIKLQELNLKNLSDEEKARERINILESDRFSLQGDILRAKDEYFIKLKALEDAEKKRANANQNISAAELESITTQAELNKALALKKWQDLTKLSNNFFSEQIGEQDKLSQLEQKKQDEKLAKEKAAADLIRSLIRDEITAKIEALRAESKAREDQAKEVFKTQSEINAFKKENEKVLAADIAKIRNEAAQAEQQAQKALTAQLIIDDEKRAIFEAENAAELRAAEIQNTFKDNDEKNAHIKQNELKLQSEIDAIKKQFADERKEKAITENDELLQVQLAAVEAEARILTANLEAKQELERQAKADELKTDEEITAFKKTQADERLKLEINLQIARLKAIKAANKLIKADQSQAIDAEINALETRLKGVGVTMEKEVKNNEGKTLGDLIGMSKEGLANSKAVQQAMEQVTAEVQKAVAARVAALQKEVDFRNKRISEIQSDLANEIELNKLGKASNIKELQDRLKSEKAARDKAEAEKKKAAEAQFVIDTTMQASNLVTAISGLYSSLSGLPFGVGVALATALSAVMIGAFIASKSQAASAAGFAEGGYTGDPIGGGKYETAGHVHRGEFVVNKEATERLGLQGASMSDFDDIMKSNYGGPNARSMARKNKQINGHISDNIRQQRADMVQAYNDGVKAALTGQNSILKDILKATENTPVVFPLEGNRFLIQRGKNKTEIKKIKR